MSKWGYTLNLTQITLPGNQLQDRGPNEIGGNLYKRWSVWFNSTVHGESYQSSFREFKDTDEGTAWLSTVRALWCSVKSLNEQNSFFSSQLFFDGGQVNMSYSIGLHTRYKQIKQKVTKQKCLVSLEKYLGSDCGLQFPHEEEIVSNRKSQCYGEDKPNSAHTAHLARKGANI